MHIRHIHHNTSHTGRYIDRSEREGSKQELEQHSTITKHRVCKNQSMCFTIAALSSGFTSCLPPRQLHACAGLAPTPACAKDRGSHGVGGRSVACVRANNGWADWGGVTIAIVINPSCDVNRLIPQECCGYVCCSANVRMACLPTFRPRWIAKVIKPRTQHSKHTTPHNATNPWQGIAGACVGRRAKGSKLFFFIVINTTHPLTDLLLLHHRNHCLQYCHNCHRHITTPHHTTPRVEATASSCVSTPHTCD